MKATLVNVRLDEARVRKARALRKSGLRLSDVVRQAIDERFEGLSERGCLSDGESGSAPNRSRPCRVKGTRISRNAGRRVAMRDTVFPFRNLRASTCLR